MNEENKNALVSIGTNSIGNVATAVVGEMIFPGAGVLGMIIGPVVTSLSEDFVQRTMSKAENERLKYVGENVVAKVKARLEAGEQPRRDEDFYVKDEYGQSSASKLLEEMLLKCKQEFEAKKMKSYSNFWSNMCFEQGVSYETANSLISQFAALSYQQIMILIYLNAGNTIQLNNRERYMYSAKVLVPYYTLYSDCLHLFSVRLAAQKPNVDGAIQVGTPEICISPSGSLMCKLLELQLSAEEMKTITEYIGNINAIVTRLMHESGDDGSHNMINTAKPENIRAMFDKEKQEIIEAARPKWE